MLKYKKYIIMYTFIYIYIYLYSRALKVELLQKHDLIVHLLHPSSCATYMYIHIMYCVYACVAVFAAFLLQLLV